MKGNKRKQWGIIYIPTNEWCQGDIKFELHWCKVDAENRIKNFRGAYNKTGYKTAKYVERA